MKKLIGLVTSLGKGAIKPLPLSGIIPAVKDVWKNKTNVSAWVKLASYILVGVALWGLITGKLTTDDLLAFVNAIL
jgi:hypothetical protein